MDVSMRRHVGGMRPRATGMSLVLIAATLWLAACSGGAGTTSNSPPLPATATCVPADPATASECGTLIIGLTDGDGDFLSYSVDVLSLQLEKRNGAVVDVLPNRARIDFAQYVDLTEFVSVATVPPGDYVAGKLRLDYTGAEVFVEANGVARAATVVDQDGVPLGQTEVTVRLDGRNHLTIVRGVTSLLTLDFDLEASHSVDLEPTPAIAVAEPFVIAELEPVDSKDIRVRGRLIEANADEMFYAIALSPFYATAQDFGRARVNVNEGTDFEINGQAFLGIDGLRALNAAGPGTLTVAVGTLEVNSRSFTAELVLAGSSVPGNGMDAVKGNVISRNGDDFVVRGGTIILDGTDRAFFRDDVVVTVGPGTVVFRSIRADRPSGMPIRRLSTDAISIGQAVTVRGTVTADDVAGIHIDATDGAVILHPTHLSGLVNTALPGQVDLALHAIDGRRVSAFDFTGTGTSPDTDADPANYEVATGTLSMASDSTGRPVAVYGFPTAFGAAPPDFEGRTVIDYTNVRGVLGIGWGSEGTTSPFVMMDATGLLLDNGSAAIDQRHHIRQGPVLIDLTALGSNTLIAPSASGRSVFAIKTGDSLQLYADFDGFLGALTLALDGVSAARSMYARGQYDADTNVFTAYRIFVYVLEP